MQNSEFETKNENQTPQFEIQNSKSEINQENLPLAPSTRGINPKFDAIVLCVAHQQFLSLDLRSMTVENGVIFDVKGILPTEIVDGRL